MGDSPRVATARIKQGNRQVTPERWQEVKKVLAGALERTPEERGVYLDQACTDPDLRREVESLITAQEQGDASFLEQPTIARVPLQKGVQLGQYTILSLTGAGGMGEVYKAHDTKLKRDIAIKVLPQAFVNDPERLARFQREAQMLASLNHPNIVTLYGVHEADGVQFLTMELVEGKTVAELIPRHGFPLPQFLKISSALADAIGAAHQHGIIHRDLKPANVMVGTDGHVKVLDFGLAKLKLGEVASQDVETLTVGELTTQHQVMGTVPYMSPEQAEGRRLDARSDIFSLGVMLHEMATGVRPFRGDGAMSVISSILRDSPQAPSEVNTALPRELDRIIRRCLAKDPARRYQSAVDLRNDLDELQQEVESGHTFGAARLIPGRREPWRYALVVVSAISLIAAYAFFWRARQLGSLQSAGLNATFSKLTSQPGIEWFPSLSPDGKWVVYSAAGAEAREIYLQSVTGQTPLDLSRNPTVDDDQPAFSPDGQHIAFRSSRGGGGIFVMGRTGEAVKRVTRMGFHPSWSPDGTQLVLTAQDAELYPENPEGHGGLWVVKLKSGKMQQLYEGDAVLASWSPHNQRIAFTHRLGDPPRAEIWTVPISGGTPAPVTSESATNWNPVWSPDGKYLYFSSDRRGSMNLWRVPIDEASGRTRGEPEPVTTPASYLAHPSLSADGKHIVYTSALVTANIQRLALDPSGAVKGEPAWVTTGSLRWSDPDPSPSGDWVVFYSLVQPEGHLYIVHPDGTGMRQLTTDSAIDRIPRWSPDSKWIGCISDRSGHLEIWKVRPDGSDLRQLTESWAGYFAWSPDGSQVAALVGRVQQSNPRLRTLIFSADRPWKEQTPEVLPPLDPPSDHFVVNAWSPDGERLVGQRDVVKKGIMTYSLRSHKYERLTDFGEWPVWFPDSRHVLFVADGKAFYILDAQSKQVRKIFSVKRDVIRPPELTRDGRTVYFSRRVTESDIWLLTLK
jgi:serine/threonine protein kinase/WD40 repeat protein